MCHFGCTYLTGSRSSLAFSDFVIFWAIWGLICDNYRRELEQPWDLLLPRPPREEGRSVSYAGAPYFSRWDLAILYRDSGGFFHE